MRKTVRTAALVTASASAFLMASAALATPGVNDCMVVHAKRSLSDQRASAFVYAIPADKPLTDTSYHIDADELPLPVVGTARWCSIAMPDDYAKAYLNTAYCLAAQAYLLATE